MIRVVKHAALDTGRLKGLTLLLALAAAVCLASLLNGGSGITARQAIGALLGAGDEAARSVMMEVRLPRRILQRETIPRHGAILRQTNGHQQKDESKSAHGKALPHERDTRASPQRSTEIRHEDFAQERRHEAPLR